MDEQRRARVANKAKRAIGEILLRDVDFPPGILVTVSSVTIKRRREFMDIYVAVFPSDNKEQVLKKLKEKRGFLQQKITKKLKIYPMPQIRFIYDEGAENAARVERQFMDNPPEVASDESEG